MNVKLNRVEIINENKVIGTTDECFIRGNNINNIQFDDTIVEKHQEEIKRRQAENVDNRRRKDQERKTQREEKNKIERKERRKEEEALKKQEGGDAKNNGQYSKKRKFWVISFLVLKF